MLEIEVNFYYLISFSIPYLILISIFSGTSPDLMPSIMGAIDALLEKKATTDEPEESSCTNTAPPPRRCFQANSFANLSPNVQKILSNVPDQEITKKFSCSEEAITRKSFRNSNYFSRTAISYKSQKEKSKSNEQLDVISTSVQKMLSNLPDSELVTVVKNDSFLHKVVDDNNKNGNCDVQCNNNGGDDVGGKCDVGVVEEEYPSKPLGSYLHTSSSGIASRMPVGRKYKGKFLQVI